MLYPVILCGGSGTRLWPLSRDMYPKQFVDLGNGRTLFGDTIRRASSLPELGEPLVVCNENHRFYVSAELLACSIQGHILLEPAPRNTAPAIALAAFAAQALTDGEDPLLLVLPSDHLLQDAKAFSDGVTKAVALAREGFIVTFGITPNSPKTGFGYIKQGDVLGIEGFKVARFVEKPDEATASAMLMDGGYSWNSGMFLFRASVYLRELQNFAPEMYTQCHKAWEQHQKEGAFISPGKDAFINSPADSIDYAVMEHTRLAAVCPLATNWNDLGSWEAFYQVGRKDDDGNVCTGDIVQCIYVSCKTLPPKCTRNVTRHGNSTKKKALSFLLGKTHLLILPQTPSTMPLWSTQDWRRYVLSQQTGTISVHGKRSIRLGEKTMMGMSVQAILCRKTHTTAICTVPIGSLPQSMFMISPL